MLTNIWYDSIRFQKHQALFKFYKPKKKKREKYTSEGFCFPFFFTWLKNDKILNLLSLAEFQTGQKGKKT